MKEDFRDKFIKILNLIGYEGNRNKYAQELYEIIVQKAVISLISSSDEEKYQDLLNKLGIDQSDENFLKLIEENFSKEEVDKAFFQTSEEVVLEYLESIQPTLSEEQKNSLELFLKSTVYQEYKLK